MGVADNAEAAVVVVAAAEKVTAAKAAVGGECGLAEARTRGVVAL